MNRQKDQDKQQKQKYIILQPLPKNRKSKTYKVKITISIIIDNHKILTEMAEQEETDYRQQLGLKKILYKYQNQNQQLRSQIRALNQRLQWILNKPKTPQIKKAPLNPIQQYQGKILKQEMQKLYKQINNQSIQMKINKDSIDERHQEKCKEMENKIIKEDKQIKQLNHKLLKYQQLDEGLKVGLGTIMGNLPKVPGMETSRLNNNSSMTNNNMSLQFPTNMLSLNNKTLRSGTIRVQNYLQRLNSIKQQAQSVRKSIKQLQHQRDSNQRHLIKKHLVQNQVKIQNRLLQENGTLTPKNIEIQENINSKKKGIWGMENTKQNYEFIKAQLQKLKKQKDTTLQMIKNQNIVLANKVKQLQNQLDGLNKSIQIPPIPYQKRPLKIPIDLSISTKLQSPLLQKKSLKPIQILGGQTQFQRKNDKNFVPKMSRKVQWQSTKNTSGIQWNDSQSKSPIIGMNLWFDGHLLGLQVLHQLGSSGQQLQVLGGKKLIPIQYRLSTGDYVENIVIYISDGFIQGIQFLSKNGRGDKFGNISKARKFDFGIKKPQKPIISFGQYKITNNVSEITKLGFQVI